MNRREALLALAALGASGSSANVRAQKPPAALPVLGILSPNPAPTPEQWVQGAVLRRLRKLGWVDGQNIRVERVYAEGREDRLPALVMPLVEKGVDVI